MALKIIGAGMGRTGTASLKVALETLNMGRCYHMTEVLKNPEYIQYWINAAEGRADWDRIYSGYSATVDNPGCNYWKELVASLCRIRPFHEEFSVWRNDTKDHVGQNGESYAGQGAYGRIF